MNDLYTHEDFVHKQYAMYIHSWTVLYNVDPWISHIHKNNLYCFYNLFTNNNKGFYVWSNLLWRSGYIKVSGCVEQVQNRHNEIQNGDIENLSEPYFSFIKYGWYDSGSFKWIDCLPLIKQFIDWLIDWLIESIHTIMTGC